MRLFAFFLLAAAVMPGLISSSTAARAMDGMSLEIKAADGKVTVYSLDEVEALGLDRIETTTTWTDGKQVFEGILLSRLVDQFAPESTRIVVKAINNYEAEIDVSEARKYPVLLAVRQNGERMSIRDKGPAWVIYPRDDYSELQDERHNFKWVWQVGAVSFK